MFIEVVYRALNDYAGSVGEVLGVGLFAALWLGCGAVFILRSGVLPRWLGVFGLVAAAALLGGLVELFGIDLGALITVTTSLVQLWMLAAGVTLLARRAGPATKPDPAVRPSRAWPRAALSPTPRRDAPAGVSALAGCHPCARQPRGRRRALAHAPFCGILRGPIGTPGLERDAGGARKPPACAPPRS